MATSVPQPTLDSNLELILSINRDPRLFFNMTKRESKNPCVISAMSSAANVEKLKVFIKSNPLAYLDLPRCLKRNREIRAIASTLEARFLWEQAVMQNLDVYTQVPPMVSKSKRFQKAASNAHQSWKELLSRNPLAYSRAPPQIQQDLELSLIAAGKRASVVKHCPPTVLPDVIRMLVEKDATSMLELPAALWGSQRMARLAVSANSAAYFLLSETQRAGLAPLAAAGIDGLLTTPFRGIHSFPPGERCSALLSELVRGKERGEDLQAWELLYRRDLSHKPEDGGLMHRYSRTTVDSLQLVLDTCYLGYMQTTAKAGHMICAETWVKPVLENILWPTLNRLGVKVPGSKALLNMVLYGNRAKTAEISSKIAKAEALESAKTREMQAAESAWMKAAREFEPYMEAPSWSLRPKSPQALPRDDVKARVSKALSAARKAKGDAKKAVAKARLNTAEVKAAVRLWEFGLENMRRGVWALCFCLSAAESFDTDVAIFRNLLRKRVREVDEEGNEMYVDQDLYYEPDINTYIYISDDTLLVINSSDLLTGAINLAIEVKDEQIDDDEIEEFIVVVDQPEHGSLVDLVAPSVPKVGSTKVRFNPGKRRGPTDIEYNVAPNGSRHVIETYPFEDSDEEDSVEDKYPGFPSMMTYNVFQVLSRHIYTQYFSLTLSNTHSHSLSLSLSNTLSLSLTHTLAHS